MKLILFVFVFLSGLTVSAKPQLQPVELHILNSRVAKLLDFSHPENYNKIAKRLSYKDKQVFQRLLAKKKAQKVKFFPFMSFLYIKDAKTQIAIQVVDVQPLKIKVDGRVTRTIDVKNIRGSFPGWKEGSVSSWWNWFIPEAQAFCFLNCGEDPVSTSVSDWELLYGYAASSEVYAGWEPMVTDSDSAIVAREASAFVNEFGINRVNCKPSQWVGFNNSSRSYVEVVGQGGHRSLLECDSLSNNCRVMPLGADGQIRNLTAERASLDHEIIRGLLELATQESGYTGHINPNALDIKCDEEACRFVAANSSEYSVPASTMERLSRLDLSDLGDRATRRRTEEQLEQFREIQRIDELHTNPNGDFYPPENRGKAMYTMMACCGSTECVSYVNGQGKVEMNTNPTSVGQ